MPASTTRRLGRRRPGKQRACEIPRRQMAVSVPVKRRLASAEPSRLLLAAIAAILVLRQAWEAKESATTLTEGHARLERLLTESTVRVDPSAAVGSALSCPTNFTFLRDRDGLERAKPVEGRQPEIPRVVYQTGPSRCISEGLFRDTVSQFHPPNATTSDGLGSWSYRFYDDALLDDYLSDSSRWSGIFPNLEPALRCIEYVGMPVMKADLWRYLVLYEHGGIFADLDVRLHPEKFEDRLLQDRDCVFVKLETAGRQVASQWFMAATPRHPIMYLSVHAAIDRVLRGKRALPLQHTGPGALYDAMGVFLKGQGPSPERNLKADVVYENGHGRSFVALSDQMAENNAAKSKQDSYQKMNITHYSHKDKGLKYGGKRCFEFLGGERVPSPSKVEEGLGIGFALDGTTYLWHNWSQY